jgi:arginyl-tRNA synthetase
MLAGMYTRYRHLASSLVENALKDLAQINDFRAESFLESPKQKDHGDIAFPCFHLAKTLRKAPVQIATELQSHCEAMIDKESSPFSWVRAVGPYLNFSLDDQKVIQEVFQEALDDLNSNRAYGLDTFGEKKKIVLEYSSPNIGKPMHIGHLRVTLVGAALDRILRHLSYEVESINHIGDWGSQFGKLVVAFELWGDEKKLEKEPFEHLSQIYVRFHKEAEEDPDLEKKAQKRFHQLEQGDEKIRKIWKKITELSLREYEKIYSQLDARFDHILGESFYEDKMQRVIEDLRSKSLLEQSEGAQIVNLEPHGLTSMIVVKSDGSTIYATRDLAAAIYRAETWNFNKLIYVVGAQQELHFRQIFKVLDLMGYAWAQDCMHVKTGWYRFQGSSLSTRKGQTVLVRDLIDKAREKSQEVIEQKNPDLDNKEKVAEEVAIGAVSFADLFTDPMKDVNFDFNRVLDFQGESGPYLQYTHARIGSILRKAAEAEMTANFKPELVVSSECSQLAKTLSRFRFALRMVTTDYKPSVFAQYVMDLANDLNRFYMNHRVMSDQDPLEVRQSRLAVIQASHHAFKECLRLLGIPRPERM